MKRETEAERNRFESTPQRRITDFAREVALFISVYGHDSFRCGEITWQWFRMLSSQIHVVEAYRQLMTSQAVTLGGGILMNEKALAAQDNLINLIYE